MAADSQRPPAFIQVRGLFLSEMEDHMSVILEKLKSLQPEIVSAKSSRIPATLTAQEILSIEFPEPSPIVPGLIYPGLTVLASKPKMGKSFFCLNIGLGLATGTEVLGIPLERREVLYVALEDTERRIQKRLIKMLLRGTPVPDGVHFAFWWRGINDTGLQDLDAWLAANPETKMVIIDTLARIRGRKRGGSSVYDADYEEIARIKEVADTHEVAIVIVHHMRKASAADLFDLVSGSTGLTGAADAVALLFRERFQPNAVLAISGRDQEDLQRALKFDAETATWELLGQADEARLTPERREIVELLKKAGSPMRLKEIAEALGKKKSNVANLLNDLGDQGMVDKCGYGIYRYHGDALEPSGESPKPPMKPEEGEVAGERAICDETGEPGESLDIS
jgi:DNA-binding transcriptional ArsR family regulator